MRKTDYRNTLIGDPELTELDSAKIIYNNYDYYVQEKKFKWRK